MSKASHYFKSSQTSSAQADALLPFWHNQNVNIQTLFFRWHSNLKWTSLFKYSWNMLIFCHMQLKLLKFQKRSFSKQYYGLYFIIALNIETEVRSKLEANCFFFLVAQKLMSSFWRSSTSYSICSIENGGIPHFLFNIVFKFTCLLLVPCFLSHRRNRTIFWEPFM